MSPSERKSITVRELGLDDHEAFLNAVEDWNGESLSWLTFEWHPAMTHEQHLKVLSDNKNGINVPADFVPSTMLYGFVEGEIVGRVHLRHALNDKLLLRGGHMGYAVAPRFRGRGYGMALARAGVVYLQKRLKVEDVLITCDEKNIHSIKIIEALGAKLENVLSDQQGVPTRRYWI